MKGAIVTSRSYLLDLQWTQLAHDERCQKDVVITPLGERVKHISLHLMRYVGYSPRSRATMRIASPAS